MTTSQEKFKTETRADRMEVWRRYQVRPQEALEVSDALPKALLSLYPRDSNRARSFKTSLKRGLWLPPEQKEFPPVETAETSPTQSLAVGTTSPTHKEGPDRQLLLHLRRVLHDQIKEPFFLHVVRQAAGELFKSGDHPFQRYTDEVRELVREETEKRVHGLLPDVMLEIVQQDFFEAVAGTVKNEYHQLLEDVPDHLDAADLSALIKKALLSPELKETFGEIFGTLMADRNPVPADEKQPAEALMETSPTDIDQRIQEQIKALVGDHEVKEVPFPGRGGRAKRTTTKKSVSIPNDLMEEVDDYCRRKGLQLSSLVTATMRAYMRLVHRQGSN